MSALSARLRVIQAEPQEQKQDCGSCRNQPNCYMKGIKEEHVITNLLVCRLKRDIDVDRSTKLFLQMVRPKLRVFARQAIRDTNLDFDVALADMESHTIDYIRRYYVMGEIAYPLHYLFGHPQGVMRHFTNNYARKSKRYEETHVLDDASMTWEEQSDANAMRMEAEDEDDTAETTSDVTRRARDIIEDGLTLTSQEYRVMKFCMMNATDAKRPLNGLHVYLSRTMGIPRAKATKVYADATRRVVQETRASQ